MVISLKKCLTRGNKKLLWFDALLLIHFGCSGWAVTSPTFISTKLNLSPFCAKCLIWPTTLLVGLQWIFLLLTASDIIFTVWLNMIAPFTFKFWRLRLHHKMEPQGTSLLLDVVHPGKWMHHMLNYMRCYMDFKELKRRIPSLDWTDD